MMANESWRGGVLLFLVVLLLSIPQAALLPLLDRDEPRFAEASREMIESGNYVVPTFNGEPRYAKPPLIYWCQALCFEALGQNAFSARLPSLLATAGTAALLYAWGAGLGSVCIGTIAGLCYPFCLQAMQQGRVATADALLIFFMTLTGYAGWRLLVLSLRFYDGGVYPDQHKRSWNLWGTILALGFAGGFLAKGPEALLPFVPLMILARNGIRYARLRIVAILLLGLFIVSWWAVPAFVQTHGDYWREGLGKDVGDRMVTGFQGHGASTVGWYLIGIPLYLLLFWVSALPWSPLLITHRRRLFDAWKPDFMDAYLLLNIGLIFLIFSLMVTKLPHYTLPAFPFIALFFARRWMAAELSPILPTQLAAGLGLLLAVVAAIGIPLAIRARATPSPVGTLVHNAQGTLSPGTKFALVDFREPNAIWEMRRVIKSPGQFISAEEVASFLELPGGRAVVLTTETWKKVAFTATGTLTVSQAQGWNAAKGAFIDLTLVVKEPESGRAR